MTLRLITTGMEQVGPGQYQTMYRTFDCKLPPTIDFSQRTVVGFEMIEDAPESIHTEVPEVPEEGEFTNLDEQK